MTKACAVAATAIGLLSITAAQAALPPDWQSAKEITAIVNDQAVHDALKYVEPILSVSSDDGVTYEVRTARCVVTATIVTQPTETVGPAKFSVEVTGSNCQASN